MVDRCVCCGEIVPEGRMVCMNCDVREGNGTRKYKSPNGYVGVLYGKSSMKIHDPNGRMVLHTGFRTPNTIEELKPVVDGFPEFQRNILNHIGEDGK